MSVRKRSLTERGVHAPLSNLLSMHISQKTVGLLIDYLTANTSQATLGVLSRQVGDSRG